MVLVCVGCHDNVRASRPGWREVRSRPGSPGRCRFEPGIHRKRARRRCCIPSRSAARPPRSQCTGNSARRRSNSDGPPDARTHRAICAAPRLPVRCANERRAPNARITGPVPAFARRCRYDPWDRRAPPGERRTGHRRENRMSSGSPWSRCSAKATSSWRTCPASARRRLREVDRALARLHASSASSSRRTSCPPTSRASTTTTRSSGEFAFREGPLVAQVVLADEINRATPRTQSALLEAMEERQLTVEGVTTKLPRPFLVIATQNPVELEGTFPLPGGAARPLPRAPEARLPGRRRRGRDSLPLRIAQPARVPRTGRRRPRSSSASRRRSGTSTSTPASAATPSASSGPRATTPRSNSAPARAPASRCSAPPAPCAAISGRDYVLPDDVKTMAPHVLPHRLILSTQARLRGRDADELLADVLQRVPVPVEA